MFQLLLLDKPFRDRVITNVSSTSTRLFWKNYDGLRQQDQLDRSESTLDRIDSLISNSIIRNVVGQSHISINFRDIMDTGKILLVSLSAQYESLTSLLGSIIIGQLLTASLSRAGTSKRRQFNLYADEYQRFATPDFATLLTEARKFGVATTIAHQVRSQLDEKNAATALQAGSLVCFRLTSEDADELSAEFLLTPKEAVKGAPTTPANILDYIDRHGNDIVKEYIFAYLRKLRSAKGGNAIGQFSHHNFGGGDVGFYQYMPDEALEAQEKPLFYPSQPIHIMHVPHFLMTNEVMIAALKLSNVLDIPTPYYLYHDLTLKHILKVAVPDAFIEFRQGNERIPFCFEIHLQTGERKFKAKIDAIMQAIRGEYKDVFQTEAVTWSFLTTTPLELEKIVRWTEEELTRIGQSREADLFRFAVVPQKQIDPYELYCNKIHRIPFSSMYGSLL